MAEPILIFLRFIFVRVSFVILFHPLFFIISVHIFNLSEADFISSMERQYVIICFIGFVSVNFAPTIVFL